MVYLQLLLNPHDSRLATPQCGLLLGGYWAGALGFRLCSTAHRMLLPLGMFGVYVNVVFNVVCVVYTPEPKGPACRTPVHQRLVGGNRAVTTYKATQHYFTPRLA